MFLKYWLARAIFHAGFYGEREDVSSEEVCAESESDTSQSQKKVSSCSGRYDNEMSRVSQLLLVVFLASSRPGEEGVERSLANNFSMSSRGRFVCRIQLRDHDWVA